MFAVCPRYIPFDDTYFHSRMPHAKYSTLDDRQYLTGDTKYSETPVRCCESLIHNTDKELQISLELHNFQPDDLKITVDSDRLVVHAEHEDKEDDQGCVSRKYTRTYKLPPNVDAATTTSSMNKNGLLSIKIAKKLEADLTEISLPVTYTSEGHLGDSEFQGCMDNAKDEIDLNDIKLDATSSELLWKSCYDEEEDESEEYSETELANDPCKRILWAAENNKLDVAKEILASEPHLVKSCDTDMYTPLHRASYNNHKDMAELLLLHGADVSSKTADGWQPLHSAARWNSVETAQLLIDAGADVNAQTNGCLTPLHMAASEPENRQMLELLLTCPFIDTSIKSKAGETAREICYRSSPNYKLFELLDDCINIFPNSL